jgi:outer membrane lipoprotein SlyB
MFKRIALVTLLAATTAITGCANSDVYSGDVYTKDRAKQAQTVSYGTILSTRPGMNEHIAKPLDLNKLNDVLKQWL